MNATRGLGPEKMTFMAEGKPGHPDAYNERMLNNAQRQNEKLRKELLDMRKEIFNLEHSNEQLTGERDRMGQRLGVMTEELAGAIVQIVGLKASYTETVDSLAEATIQVIELRRQTRDLNLQVAEWKLKEVKLAREVFDLQGSNDTLRKMMKAGVSHDPQ